VPFLPVVLLVAWQAVSRSASFALGWATALYFGQVPGRPGRILSVISLLAAAWVVLLIGFAIPIFGGALLEAMGAIEENFDLEPIHYLALTAAVVAIPPFVAACIVYGEFQEEKSLGAWLRLLPVSYPATFMLGVSVLLMVVITPFLLFQRWRQKRAFVQVPVMMREGSDDDLHKAVAVALRQVGVDELAAREATGPKAWPMRTVAFAAEHLLGAVVRGEPVELAADGMDVYLYATNVSILGPKEAVYRARAAIERELAFADAYITWNEEAQAFERELMDAQASGNGDRAALERRLDEIQGRIDAASLNSEEWNVLYRLRLQVEQRAARR
jgi:hypothetical protein